MSVNEARLHEFVGAEYSHAMTTVSAHTGTRIHTAEAQDGARLATALTFAFVADPAARWLYPDPLQYFRFFPRFVRAFGGGAVGLGMAYYTDGFAGCALWLPPGEGPDEAALGELIERSVPRHQHREVFALLEAMGAVHPTEPHWYLPLIGVDAAFQGRQLGSALLRHTLKMVDRDGLPAYLEATSPRNISLYERHGFRRLEPLQVGTCPPIMPMWRVPSCTK